MAMRNPTSKRKLLNIKRLIFLFVLIFIVTFWDFFNVVFKGLVLLFRPSGEPTSLLVELLNYWGGFVLLIIFLLFTFSIFLLLNGHFILPHLSLEQHLEIWKRLWLYLVGRHGAAVFIRHGQVVGEFGKKSKQGAGLLLIDRHSAVLVEESGTKKPTQVKVYSPGIVFLNPHQRIRGSVDLRPQRRSIADLRAYMKDGVEILTNLSTTFTLGQPADVLLVTYHSTDSQNQFTPDALRVIQFSDPNSAHPKARLLHRTVSALSNEIDPADREEIHRFIQNFHLQNPEKIDVEQSASSSSQYYVDPQRIIAAFYSIPSMPPLQTNIDWSDLPLQIAIDLFREFIATIPYESIYHPHRPLMRTLTELKSLFSKRMRNQGVLAFQFVHRKDNLPIRIGDEWDISQLIFYPVQNLNNPKFLRSKGIKILNATFGELKPADEMIEKRLFDEWLAGYQKRSHFSPNNIAKTTSPLVLDAKQPPAPLQAEKPAPSFQGLMTDNQQILRQFFERLENEIANPQVRQCLSYETIELVEQLRSQLLTNPSTPSEDNQRS